MISYWIAECLWQFNVFCNIYLYNLTPAPFPGVTPQLFNMQISCPILAIVQHKVTIANK